MSSPPESSGSQPGLAIPAATRWSLYALLIVVGASLITARIMAVRSPDPKSPTPFQSANDKSRWATIRALGDDGTYALDHIIFDGRGNQVRGWYTIDLVRHRGPDGREHYYSSKPTLLPTLLAGQYWLVRTITGASLGDKPHYVARIMLVLTNVLPLVLAQVLLVGLIDRLATTDWSRFFAASATVFATFISTYSVTLNNHTIAAISVVCGLAVVLPVWADQRREWWRLALAGLAFAFAAANELPALSLCVLVAVGLMWKSPLQTALAYVPAALLVGVAALGTNYLAHGDWRTPYAHRQDGPVLAMLEDRDAVALNEGRVSDQLLQKLRYLPERLSDQLAIEQRIRGERWELFDQQSHLRLALVRTPEGEPNGGIEIRRWDNWYDYPGTHWDPSKLDGLDRGEPSPLVYALHCLIGHHGLFSLTPIWLLSLAGCVIWLRRGDSTSWTLALTTIVITLVVLAFYLTRPQIDRNYGGGTCCLRWLLWITPLWLLTMLPAVDWLSGTRWGRAIALALLAISVFSVHYAADNPWRDPWIYDYWTQLGWIKY